MSISFWVCAAVTAISAGVSFGYAVAGVRANRGAAADQPAGPMYAFSRSIALLVVAIVALFAGSEPFLVAAAIAMIIVQAGDAVVGARLNDRFKTVGPAATALANAAALAWLLPG